MKKQLFFIILFLSVIVSADASAQQPIQIGTWKMISRKVTMSDGRYMVTDSSNTFSRKIITPTHFVVMHEFVKDGKKIVNSAAGGHYTLKGTDYVELIEFASYPDYDKLKTKFTLTFEGEKMHQIGTLEGSDGLKTIYDEWYIREK